mmetsp:Transcript_2781/g.2312  ORF Transcript_2781/g.2312 Transcript_2781/m.2312 type:complete len:92 (+) Transcript_2781:240-515(+)
MKNDNLTGGFKLNSISNLEFVQTLNISHSSSISITIMNLTECSQFYSLIQEKELYKYTNFELVLYLTKDNHDFTPVYKLLSLPIKNLTFWL